MDDMVIARLHRALVEAMLRTRPGVLDRPVTVAEIYQDLVPYRTARTEIGFEMNADYEHALLRLLAGEGDLARIEPREIRDKLRMELESANPDVGLYRSYAACDVWVNLEDAAPMEAAGPVSSQPESWEDEFVGPDAEESAPDQAPPEEGDYSPALDDQQQPQELDFDAEPAPARSSTPFEIAAAATGPEEKSPQPAESSQQPGETSVSCAFCGHDLPASRLVNFCPYCGSDQSKQPCPSCGELLDPLWRFCVGCGSRVRAADEHLN